MSLDYRDAKTYSSETEAKQAKETPAMRDASMWWAKLEDEGARANYFIEYARKLHNEQRGRESAIIRHVRLYENVEVNSLSGPDYATAIVRSAMLGQFISLNVVAACIDTLCAKISKNKPVPEFQTSGASWKSQMKARKLNKWVQGFLYETKAYEKMKDVFRDCEVIGTSPLYIYVNDDSRLEVERTLPGELHVDDADGMAGCPRQVLRRKLVQREVLAAQFPKKASEIMSAPRAVDTEGIDGRVSDLMVEVWEGWHLPSSKGAKDGKHIIAIETCELSCEPWLVDVFPFVFLRSKGRVLGFWGKGTAEALTGIQVELNRLVRSVSEQLRRKGKGQIFVERGSKIISSHLTNKVGDIVEYTGKQPTWNNANVVSQEEFSQIDRLYQRAFQEVGISELSAAARKPAGLDAGVALREFSDIESERFALKHQAWELAFMDLVQVAIALITKQYPSLRKGYSVRVPGRRRAIEVDWKDIDLDEESYIMQMYPASSLPQTPAARKQFVKELEADGMISKAVAKRLLGFPDVEAEMDLGNAALDDVDATISAILDDDKPKLHPPEPFQNLELLVERGLANYLFARHFEDIEPERLEMLRSLIDMTTRLMEEQMKSKVPPMPPPGPAPGGPPPGPAPAPGVGTVNISGGDVNVPPQPVAAPLVA